MGNRRPSVSDVSDIGTVVVEEASDHVTAGRRSRDNWAQISYNSWAQITWQQCADHVTTFGSAHDSWAQITWQLGADHVTAECRSRDSWVQVTWQPERITRDRHADWPSVAGGVAAGPAALHSPAGPGGQGRSPYSRSGLFLLVICVHIFIDLRPVLNDEIKLPRGLFQTWLPPPPPHF